MVLPLYRWLLSLASLPTWIRTSLATTQSYRQILYSKTMGRLSSSSLLTLGIVIQLIHKSLNNTVPTTSKLCMLLSSDGISESPTPLQGLIVEMTSNSSATLRCCRTNRSRIDTLKLLL
jgi:hypothetical protein